MSGHYFLDIQYNHIIDSTNYLAGLWVLDLLEVGGGRGGVGADDGRVPTPLPPVEGDEGQQQHHDDDDDAADDAGGNVDLGAGPASLQVHQALAQL